MLVSWSVSVGGNLGRVAGVRGHCGRGTEAAQLAYMSYTGLALGGPRSGSPDFESQPARSFARDKGYRGALC
jgi:hypothetical protein